MVGEEGSPRPQWFSLRVRTGSEKTVSLIARNKGFEEFLPTYTSVRRWSDRSKPLALPLFPGYVFCRLALQDRLSLLTIPSVQGFVAFGQVPAPIDDAEIANLRIAVRSQCAEPWPYLEVGQRIRLEEGPLQGLEGFLVEIRKRQRILVSIDLLKRSVVVDIDRQWIRPLAKAS